MLSEEGTISAVPELMDMIDTFLAEYETAKGPPRNDLEHGLIIAYLLGVMQCDLNAIWDSLGEASVFRTLHPRTVFEECAGGDEPAASRRRSDMAEEFRRRGWPCGDAE